jgi:hypothetical protein
MTWVTWRQHRAHVLACAVLLVLIAAFAIAAGAWTRATFSADGLPGCLARDPAGCQAGITSFRDAAGVQGLATAISVPLLAIPVFLGIATGAPLLGRELERGTWQLAWSQTVSRTRWLATELGLVTAGLVIFGAAVTALMTWYRQPLDRVGPAAGRALFDGEGLTFTAALLCSFGLAVLAGLLFRNVVGAMVAAYIAWEIPTGVVLLTGAGPGHLPVTGFWPVQAVQGGLYLVIAAASLSVAVWLLHRRTTLTTDGRCYEPVSTTSRWVARVIAT